MYHITEQVFVAGLVETREENENQGITRNWTKRNKYWMHFEAFIEFLNRWACLAKNVIKKKDSLACACRGEQKKGESKHPSPPQVPRLPSGPRL